MTTAINFRQARATHLLEAIGSYTSDFLDGRYNLQCLIYDTAKAMKEAGSRDVSRELRAYCNTLPDGLNPHLNIGDHHCDLIVASALRGEPFQTCKGPYSGR